jgi:transposase
VLFRNKNLLFERYYSAEQASKRWQECIKSLDLTYRIESSHKIALVSLTYISYHSKTYLAESNPENYRVHLIWDNARPHKNDGVYTYAKKLNIKLHYLTPYSSNLNPVERVWKLMHESIRYNKYYGKFTEFTEATLNFFRYK